MEGDDDSSVSLSARSDQLAPIRTGREIPPNDISPPSSVSEYGINDDISIQHREPLPPIGSPRSQNSDIEIVAATSSVIASTVAGTNTRQSTNRPKITQSFRREIENEKLTSNIESDTFIPILQSNNLPTRNIETQTEWSWLGDMELMKKNKAARVSAKSEVPEGETTETNEIKVQKPKTAESRRGLESEMTFASESSIPYPPKDDEYGIPILHLSSESEDSDDESEILYQRDDAEELDEPGILPTIGPPEILKYQKETKKKTIDVDSSESKLLNEDDIEAAQMLKDQAEGGVFEGVCDFCGNPIKPFPSLDEQKYRAPEDLYCCNDYQEFVLFMVRHPIQQEHSADKLIDIKPHPPYGSKQARRAAKEKAMARMREREMQRQQAAMAAAGVGGGGGGGGGGGANFYQFARQMKTINYQLSSQKCMEEGWTLRPTSPEEEDDLNNEIFEPEPVWPGAEDKINNDNIMQKFYDDGALFIIMFADGTGSVFYHSGRHAITITSTEPGLYTYIIQDDTEEGTVMGVFEPSGYGCVYYNNGMIRLFFDQIGGLESDSHGVRKKKWSWKDWKETHVHAPPIQPITFAITSEIGIRIMTQEHISLTFVCKSQRARFQVGTRLKLVKRAQFPRESEMDEDELYRQEVSNRVQSLFNKVSNLLKFPNSPKLHKLPTPGHLSNRALRLEQIREERPNRKTKKHVPAVIVN